MKCPAFLHLLPVHARSRRYLSQLRIRGNLVGERTGLCLVSRTFDDYGVTDPTNHLSLTEQDTEDPLGGMVNPSIVVWVYLGGKALGTV